MNKKELKDYWKKEEAQAFKGWDFSYLEGRWEDEALSWNYKEAVQAYLRDTDTLLDMGTGGGEFLLSLGHPHHLTTVTEAYVPNVELCMETLAPLGICVKQVLTDEELPLESYSFDTVINRHEAYVPSEVARIIKPGGYFITQQIGGLNDRDLSEALLETYEPALPNHNLVHSVQALKQVGFEILVQEESYTPLRFFDTGALVYFAKIIQWEFPGFSVEKCFKELCALEEVRKKKGYIEGTEHRFFIVAKRLHSS